MTLALALLLCILIIPMAYAASPSLSGVDNEKLIENDDLTKGNPKAPVIPLYKVGVAAAWVGNDPFSDNAILGADTDDWTRCTQSYSYSLAPSSMSATIDANGYSYIRIRIVRWGYCNTYNEKLDTASYISENRVDFLDADGNSLPIGGMVYGFVYDYVFKVPKGKTTSTAIFQYVWYSTSPIMEKEANLKIAWVPPQSVISAPTASVNSSVSQIC